MGRFDVWVEVVYNVVMESRNRVKKVNTQTFRWDAPTGDVYALEAALDIKIGREDRADFRKDIALPVDEFIKNTMAFIEALDENIV